MVKYKYITRAIEQYTKSENGTRIPQKARTQLQKFTEKYADDLNQEHLGYTVLRFSIEVLTNSGRFSEKCG